MQSCLKNSIKISISFIVGLMAFALSQPTVANPLKYNTNTCTAWNVGTRYEVNQCVTYQHDYFTVLAGHT